MFVHITLPNYSFTYTWLIYVYICMHACMYVGLSRVRVATVMGDLDAYIPLVDYFNEKLLEDKIFLTPLTPVSLVEWPSKHLDEGAIPKYDMGVGRGVNVDDLINGNNLIGVSPKISIFTCMPRTKENLGVSLMDPPTYMGREDIEVLDEVLILDINFVLEKGQQSKVTFDPLYCTCLGFGSWVPQLTKRGEGFVGSLFDVAPTV